MKLRTDVYKIMEIHRKDVYYFNYKFYKNMTK